jgi:hypothetical protein
MLSSKETFYGPIAIEWLGRGVWLSNAWEKLGDQHLVTQAREQADRFAALCRTGETVETFKPARRPPELVEDALQCADPLRQRVAVIGDRALQFGREGVGFFVG